MGRTPIGFDLGQSFTEADFVRRVIWHMGGSPFGLFFKPLLRHWLNHVESR